MDKTKLDNQDKIIKKIQEEIQKEALSEFNKFRLSILANQIKYQNYGHSLNKVSNL